ncbi:hypothetical protein KSP40_PGU019366 [Platanthera guangdongensis]|uniref:Uncharacterized protein n=1 Tax=Platanthera guangdongensis TaxID=2320717 RepID=A0ABR2MY30_9ASPA
MRHSYSQGEQKESKLQGKPSTSSTAEQDLDVFLLGDLGSSDEGPDGGNDDDFDKLGGASIKAPFDMVMAVINRRSLRIT